MATTRIYLTNEHRKAIAEALAHHVDQIERTAGRIPKLADACYEAAAVSRTLYSMMSAIDSTSALFLVEEPQEVEVEATYEELSKRSRAEEYDHLHPKGETDES